MKADEIVPALVEELQPVRRLRGVEWRTLLWAAFALSCVAAVAHALGARSDLASKLHHPRYLLENGLLLLIFALSSWSAFQLSVPGAERSRGMRALPMLGVLLWAWLIAAGHPAAPDDSASSGWLCVWRMTCLSLAPAAAALFALHKAAPLDPGWTGWFALLSAASLGMVGTQLVCGRDDSSHLLAWHFWPVLVAAMAGVHLGRRFLVRDARPARLHPVSPPRLR